MTAKKLIQIIIGAIGFIIEKIDMDAERSEIIFSVRLTKKERCRCGICRRKARLYDRGRGRRRWRCADIGGWKVYIEADEPRVFCDKHGVVAAAVPWARHGSWFTKSFEETAAWLALHMSKNAIAQYLRIEWATVGSICRRIYGELEKRLPSRFDGLKNIGIDETSYRKGHKYMTAVINHDTGKVVWCGVGFGKEVLSKFFEQLTPEQRASIRCVSADGAKWIASCVGEYCPNAELCIDPFHVVSWAADVLDKVRREAAADARKSEKPKPKRGRGRPRKGEEPSKDEQPSKAIKGCKYALLKNPENTTDGQKAQLDFLMKANPKLYRAYLLKENLRLALKAGADEIAEAIGKWMVWAQRCRIKAFRELRKKIKRNMKGIIATAKHGLSNARMEAVNNNIKLVIRKAYGFRNMENMLAMIMLSCSSARPQLPAPLSFHTS